MTETRQALDAVSALVGTWRKPQADDECTLYTMGKRNGRNACASELDALLPALRAYIHRIETSHPSYDNAVRIRQLEEQVEQLQAALGEAERDAEKWRDAEACMKAVTEQEDMALAYACALLLASNTQAVNAARGTIRLGECYDENGNDLGDWTITVERTRAAIDAMAAGEDA